MTQGAVLSTYAEGAFDDFLKNGRPALVGKSEYESWVQDALPEEPLCRRRATVRRSAGPLHEYGPGGRTVPGRSPHRSGQRRAAAAAHGRGRRRRLRHRTRRQNRSAPPLHRRLPLGAIRLRSRRDDSLRHTRQPGVHAPETGGALPLRLARPSGGHHSPLLLLHHRQRRREHDGQTPLVRHDDLLPDPAVHGEQDPGTVQGA